MFIKINGKYIKVEYSETVDEKYTEVEWYDKSTNDRYSCLVLTEEFNKCAKMINNQQLVAV